MCFPQKLKVRTTVDYKWGGDIIVNDPVVASFRRIPGTRKKYDIDVRNFLRTKGNAVISQELTHVREFAELITVRVEKSPPTDAPPSKEERGFDEVKGSEFFLSKKPGAFDFRANVIMSYLSESFTYDTKKTKKDPWLFPEETLSGGAGDCEDFAFLVASMLISSGISSYNVRVALGAVQFYENGNPVEKPKGHAWVMYKQENSNWRVIEATVLAKAEVVEPVNAINKIQVSASTTTVPIVSEIEYLPQFVFNDDHLWIMDVDDKKCHLSQHDLKRDVFPKINKRWNKLNTRFHGDVHKGIIEEAAAGSPFLDQLEARFRKAFIFFGKVVDDVDNPLFNSYTPIEHFDSGYIKQGWAEVAKNIALFKADQQHIFPLCKALHAVADFYAHSTYAHFAKHDAQGNVAIFDPAHIDAPIASADYVADPTFKAKLKKCSVNKLVFTGHDRNTVIAGWKGILISGRYAMTKEDGQRKASLEDSLSESISVIPKGLINDPGDNFSLRGALPHHNEMAVDEPDISPFHVLYDQPNYVKQYGTRRKAAVAHIRHILDTL